MKKEKHYKVKWEIDIWATSAEEAAVKALEIQRDPKSTATVFLINSSQHPNMNKRVDVQEVK